MPPGPIKVIVIGPKQTGKSCISNYLSGQSDKLVADKYEPTAGVRILEFDIRISSSTTPLNIELWDSSGDHTYETCWKAIMQDTDGVILIYNPDAPGQEQQLSDWYEYFVKRNGLKDSQCIIFAHKSSNSMSEKFKPPTLFSRVTAALTTSQSGNDVRGMFEEFVKELYSNKNNSSSRK